MLDGEKSGGGGGALPLLPGAASGRLLLLAQSHYVSPGSPENEAHE